MSGSSGTPARVPGTGGHYRRRLCPSSSTRWCAPHATSRRTGTCCARSPSASTTAPRSEPSAQRRRQVHPSAGDGRRGRADVGRGQARRGFTVGLLAQEPVLDHAKDVIGNVMEGWHRSRRSSTATRKCWRVGPTRMRLRRPRHRAGRPGAADRGGGCLGPRAQGGCRHGRPPGAPERGSGDHPLGRAPPGGAVPAPAFRTRPAAAR